MSRESNRPERGERRISVAAAGDAGVRIGLPGVGLEALVQVVREAEGRDEIAAAIAGHESVLLLFREGMSAAKGMELAEEIASAAGEEQARPAAARHEIEVSFAPEEAPDLGELLAAAGVTREKLIEQIRSVRLRARFLGFRPGFAYLEGLPPAWRLPRLGAPRAEVPEGSFGIAGAMCGFYPSRSPGGWKLVGRTDAMLWDPRREPPNRIAVGDEVAIVPVVRPLRFDSRPAPSPAGGMRVGRVVGAGTASFVVGAPDPERLRWGLPAGGAFDAEAAAAANRCVGNREDAAVLEVALSGPRIRFDAPVRASWGGARARIRVDGREVADPRVLVLGGGSELEIGPLAEGARGWLAISGGLVDPARRSLPSPLVRGEELRGVSHPEGRGRIGVVVRRAPAELEALAGPDPLTEEWLEILREEAWEVTPRSDRAGIRFRSGRRAHGLPSTLPSAGMQFGTVQWLPDGDLVAMGPDHPLTGGYLQAMTLLRRERGKLAQLRPGDRIRWRIELARPGRQ